jgi:hypothetical protein
VAGRVGSRAAWATWKAGVREETIMKERLVAIAIVLMAAAGCGGDDGGDPDGECADVSGTWGFTGECGADLCQISQDGCAVDFDCDASAFTGTVDGDDLTLSGSASGVDGDCTGTIDGDGMSGTCQTELGPCDFAGVRQ